MVIIDTQNFKACKGCGDYVMPVGKIIWNGRCKECRHYDYLCRYYTERYDYIRLMPKLHLRRGGYDDIIGCTQQGFKDYLESKFESWMTWRNKASYLSRIKPLTTWDLDHIIPWHTATTDKEKRKLCHYTNIQPLCSYENRYVKRGKTTVK